MERRMFEVLVAGAGGFTALFFWMHNLRMRMLALADRALEPGTAPAAAAATAPSGPAPLAPPPQNTERDGKELPSWR
jgi:hypothetical protein